MTRRFTIIFIDQQVKLINFLLYEADLKKKILGVVTQKSLYFLLKLQKLFSIPLLFSN